MNSMLTRVRRFSGTPVGQLGNLLRRDPQVFVGLLIVDLGEVLDGTLMCLPYKASIDRSRIATLCWPN